MAVGESEVPATLPADRRAQATGLLYYRHLVAVLVSRELKVRYKRSAFGLLWTMLNPLLLMVVYTIVFSTIMKVSQTHFEIFLLSALLPWLFFSTAVMQGLGSVLANQELIRKIKLPQAVFPLSVVGSNLVNFVLSLAPLLLLMLVEGQPFTPALLFLPAAILILTVFTCGVTLLLASATVFFRDVRHLAEVLLQIVFYLSPVIYGAEQIAPRDVWWYQLFRDELAVNPFVPLLSLLRDPVYYGHLPAAPTILASCAWALGSIVVGYSVFARLEPRHIHHF